MVYNINGFLFDASRQLLFRETTSEDIIQKLTKVYDLQNTVQPLDLQFNPDSMEMNNVALGSAGICLSFNCNLRCQYCGYSSEENDSNNLQLDDIKVFLKDIIRRRTINKILTKKNEPLDIEITGGGEPTYDWDLFYKTIEYIKKICIENEIPVRIRLTTNGMITEEQADYIAENITHIMVSYDGLPDIQSRNRFSPYEKKSSEKVETTIRRLAAAGASMTIRSTIWQEDFGKISDMYRHVCDLVKTSTKVIWSLYPVLFEGRAIKKIQNQEEIGYKRFLEECVVLLKNQSGSETQKKIPIDIALFNNDPCTFFCGAHRAMKPWLLPNKSIVTCIESKEDKTYIGRIADGVVHYSTNYQDRLLKIAQMKYFECLDCIAYSVCKGGCPIWHLRVDNKFSEPLECTLQKEYWRYIVHALTAGEYSMGWKMEKLDGMGASGHEIYKVVKEEVA